MDDTNKRGARRTRHHMRPRMQISFLSNCDDVALPALKLDPDAEMARVVLADVEIRQRAVLHDVECSCDDRFWSLKIFRVDCHQRASSVWRPSAACAKANVPIQSAHYRAPRLP